MTEFKCLKCGKCCFGDGLAFLYPEDVINMANGLSISLQETVDLYCDYVLIEVEEDNNNFSFIPYLVLKKENNHCIFLKNDVCQIHQFKPFQCKNTPFVEEFFTDIAWQKTIRKECPACNKLSNNDIKRYEHAFFNSFKPQKEEIYFKQLKDNSYNLEKILNITLKEPEIIQF
jgi:Fe-S-cluster containining protein